MEPAEVEKLIGELEIAVDRLRSLYEQYFMGIEKLEPTVPRKDVDRRIHTLRKEQVRNTALRFRFQMILQRYNTYQTHWQRICREIENGTYKRHVVRAQQRFGAEQPKPAAAPAAAPQPGSRGANPAPGAPVLDTRLAAELADLDREFAPAEELDDLDLEEEETPLAPTVAARPSAAGPPRPPPPPGARRPDAPVAAAPVPPRAPAPATPAPAPAPAPASAAAQPGAKPVWRKAAPEPPRGDLSEQRVRQLYAQYVEVKRRQNESTAAITYEAVAKSLRESSAKLRQKHGKAVDFEVSVKDGKTILKPVLK